MTTATATVRTATPADEQQLLNVLLLAFSADPVARWIFPDAGNYVDSSPAMARAFAGRAFQHGTAFYIDGYGGAALWLPPGVTPDEESMIEVLQRAVPADRLETFGAVMEQMGAYHPAEDHWYLPMIGVEPAWQHKGLGSALLAHSLAVIDSHDGLAYLESSNPLNLPLYERFGFRTIGVIDSGSVPLLYPMVRNPHGA